ncbi:uncharacterized protein MCYG_08546 [Microsporum canis CBS 113480]|uniref:Rhodopsin domain-containing protein n=1 Tax=Arthroderma otae (strain ATCC MYA-4605 / CBS 113480) TaxID=554155 RepID=C5G0S4_ARTOC|nr:uncharacterized protein MCYG_08546 [Microsporum canis CBS 113480]EEQ35727.1 predicted protein [Microsporum canis CBS 113480]
MDSRDLSAWQMLPAGPPPPGVKSNFVDPPSLAMPIVIVNGISLALMLAAVIARFLAKGLYSKLRWDLSDAVDIIYIVTSFFIKISILLLLEQLFYVIRHLRQVIYIGLAVISTVTVPYLTVSIIRVSQCNGFKAIGITICNSKAVGTTNLVFGPWNVLSDFYILAIPISQIQQLKMPYRRKIGVTAIFLTGFIACSMSIVRLVIIIAKFNKKDPIYTGASLSPYRFVGPFT